MEKIQHVLKDVNLLSGVNGHDLIQKGLQEYVAAESELNCKLVRGCKTLNNMEFLFFTMEKHFRKNLSLLSELNWLLRQASEEIVTSENSSLLLTMLGADKNNFTFIPAYLSEFISLLQKLEGSKAKELMRVIYDVLKNVSLYQQSKAAIQRWHSIFKDLMASRRFLEIITKTNETLSQDYNSSERSVMMECKIAADCHVVLITDALLIIRRNMFRWELIRWLCLKDIVACKSVSDLELFVYFSTKTVKMVLIFEDCKSLMSMKNSIDTALSSKRVLRRKSCSDLRHECIEHETIAKNMSTSCPTLNFKVSQHTEEAAYQTDSGYSSTESFHKNHEENLDKRIAQIFASPTKIIPTPPSSRKPVSMNNDPRLSRYVRKK
ncbi:hypothetical protein MP638_002512 [Amoeboaphelidium occidentale]|nr:hypothetical protein MP638_002512 [Amoeboaphelidium occidentale]